MKKNNQIMLEPFMKKHAQLFAETHCTMELGLTPDDVGYEAAYKKAFKKFLDEAVQESMIPFRANPTAPKVSKNQTAIFFSTDPNQFFKSYEEAEKNATLVRSAVAIIFNVLYKTKYNDLFTGDPTKDFRFKTADHKNHNLKVLRNRFARTSIYATIIAFLDYLFSKDFYSHKELDNVLGEIVKGMNLDPEKFDPIKIGSKKKVGVTISKYTHDSIMEKVFNIHKGQQKLDF